MPDMRPHRPRMQAVRVSIPGAMAKGTVPAPPHATAPGSVGDLVSSCAVGRKSWDGEAELVVGVRRIGRE